MTVSLNTVRDVYEKFDGKPLENNRLYLEAARASGLPDEALSQLTPIGKRGEKRSALKRQIRWHQQTLKQMGVIERAGDKGIWALAEEAKKSLNMAKPGVKLVAYSTDLGVAIWGDCKDVLANINEPIHLCLTSPPYPLKVARNYGNVDEKAWVEFLLSSLEPIVRSLAPGGSVVLNVSNDIFEHKKPSKSLYIERMVLALHDDLGLHLMDRIPWVNLSKPPGPTWWTCRQRKQLSHGYEPIFWFTNDPDKVNSNNNRVLEPHSENHKKLMAAGGDQRSIQYADGAYTLRPGSFGKITEGKIPKNVIMMGHACKDTRMMRKASEALNLPPHSAVFPTGLADFFIEFLTEEGQLVVDLFSGSNKVGLSAERKGRHWLAVEKTIQYIRSQAEAFSEYPGFVLNPDLYDVA